MAEGSPAFFLLGEEKRRIFSTGQERCRALTNSCSSVKSNIPARRARPLKSRFESARNASGGGLHMEKLRVYAFADEASPALDGQIAAMNRNGLQGLEIRGVDGANVSDISVEKAREVRRRLADAGLTVWSVGSPIGKIDLEKDDFAAHLDKLRHTLEVGRELGAQRLRMFSFYIPAGRSPESCRQQVVDQMGEMLRVGEGSGLLFCHENEKGIYGDVASRCKELLDLFPQMAGVFDPANFIQCGQDTWAGWELLASRIQYLHIKDALADDKVVPAGHGIGQVRRILAAYRAQGGNDVTIEPHLQVFSGLQGLEREGEKTQMGAYCYESSDAAFDAACAALREIC